jgi:hypothetical protein
MRSWTWMALPMTLAACAPESADDPGMGGQFGEETGGGCQLVSSTPLALDEVAPNGRAAQDLVDLAVGSFEATLTWAGGTEAALSLETIDPIDARFDVYESVDDGSMEIDLGCPRVIVVDVDALLSTDDGALAETMTWSIEMGDGAPGVWVDMVGLSGTFDPWDFTTEDFDTVEAALMVEFTAAGPTGTIEGYGESTGGGGDDAAVSLSRFDVASF